MWVIPLTPVQSLTSRPITATFTLQEKQIPDPDFFFTPFCLCSHQWGQQRSSARWSWSEPSCSLRNSRTENWPPASALRWRPKAGCPCGGVWDPPCSETCPSLPCTGTATTRGRGGCVNNKTPESPRSASPSPPEQCLVLWAQPLNKPHW